MRNTLVSKGFILSTLWLTAYASAQPTAPARTPAELVAPTTTPQANPLPLTPVEERPALGTTPLQQTPTPTKTVEPSPPQETITPPPAQPATKKSTTSIEKQTTSVAPTSDTLLDDPKNLLAQRTIYFDFDSCYIKAKYEKMLNAHAHYLRHHAADILLIEGHTDEKGAPEYNKQLSARRAENVRHALRYRGVSEKQLKTLSIGETHPKNKEHNAKAWAENRRSELIYNPK